MAAAEPDTRRRADYGGLALVFAELADCRPQWKEALEGWNVEQSLQVLEWQAQAYAEGEAKGKAEGEAKGKAEGEAKGKAEGEAKGKAETLLRVLRGRFPGQVPPDLAAKILATKDLGQLDQWVDAAAQVASFEDFRRLIPT